MRHLERVMRSEISVQRQTLNVFYPGTKSTLVLTGVFAFFLFLLPYV
jgi:hypothetical protein